jgi:phthiocerol/phenolphthiocerol synthesis type-I polyketide synthase D
VPFDGRRGAELLHQAISHQAPHLVAMDYRPTADPSPVAVRLAELMGPRHVGRDAKRDPRSAPRDVTEPEPLIPLIRRILATTLRVATEHVDTAADFNDLGLTSLLAVEMRRTLEHELGIRIATAELFRHPTVEVLAATLAERIAPVASDRIS